MDWVSCLTDFFAFLTKGGAYRVLREDIENNLLTIINDSGEERAYHRSYFTR